MGQSVRKDIQIALFDITGKLIDKRVAYFDGLTKEEYQMHDLSNGTYFLQLKMEDELVRTIQFEVQ